MAHNLSRLDVPTEDTVLQTLADRFANKKISTLVGPVLIAFNGEFSGENELTKYRRQNLDEEEARLDPAHLYFFLLNVHKKLFTTNKSRTVILSGTKSAGKTQLLFNSVEFLTITQPNIGNIFTRGYDIISAFDGLEAARAVRTVKDTYNFNIFYYVIHGLSPIELSKLFLTKKSYNYVKPHESNEVDYHDKLRQLKEALVFIDCDNNEIDWVFKAVAAVLQLGELIFEEEDGKIKIKNMLEFKHVIYLLDIKCGKKLEKVLCTSDESLKSKSKEERIKSCENKRNTFGMLVYTMVSTWLIDKINKCFQPEETNQCYIGFVDLYSNYDHTHNQSSTSSENQEEKQKKAERSTNQHGLGEFVINFANEKLRQFFYKDVFESSPIEFQDNDACVYILENIFKLLKESSTFTATGSTSSSSSSNNQPKTSSENMEFSEEDYLAFKSKLEKSSETKMESGGDRVVKFPKEDDKVIRINHFHGIIEYNLYNWYKTLHTRTEYMIQSLLYICKLSSLINCTRFMGLINRNNKITGILYMSLLEELIENIQQTECDYIHCIRINENPFSIHSTSAAQFNQSFILPQLKHHGFLELAEISQYLKNSHEFIYSNQFPGEYSRTKLKKKEKKSKKKHQEQGGNNQGGGGSNTLSSSPSKGNVKKLPTPRGKRLIAEIFKSNSSTSDANSALYHENQSNSNSNLGSNVNNSNQNDQSSGMNVDNSFNNSLNSRSGDIQREGGKPTRKKQSDPDLSGSPRRNRSKSIKGVLLRSKSKSALKSEDADTIVQHLSPQSGQFYLLNNNQFPSSSSISSGGATTSASMNLSSSADLNKKNKMQTSASCSTKVNELDIKSFIHPLMTGNGSTSTSSLTNKLYLPASPGASSGGKSILNNFNDPTLKFKWENEYDYSDDELVLSDDELEYITDDSEFEETENNPSTSPTLSARGDNKSEKNKNIEKLVNLTFKNRIKFLERNNTIKFRGAGKNFIDQVENFSWKQNNGKDDLSQSRHSQFSSLTNIFSSDGITKAISDEEYNNRREEFLFLYEFGSLLRVIQSSPSTPSPNSSGSSSSFSLLYQQSSSSSSIVESISSTNISSYLHSPSAFNNSESSSTFLQSTSGSSLSSTGALYSPKYQQQLLSNRNINLPFHMQYYNQQNENIIDISSISSSSLKRSSSEHTLFDDHIKPSSSSKKSKKHKQSQQIERIGSTGNTPPQDIPTMIITPAQSSSPSSSSHSGNLSPGGHIHSDEDSDDGLVGIGGGNTDLDELEKSPEFIKWEREATIKLLLQERANLEFDSIDSIVNHINFNNPIKASPQKQKQMVAPAFFLNKVEIINFMSYAESYFTIPNKLIKLKAKSQSKYKNKFKKLISATQQPIRAPLHGIRTAKLAQIAVDNFKHILGYMIYKEDSPTTINSISTGSNSNNNLSLNLTQSSSLSNSGNTVGVSNDATSFYHAYFIIKNGLEFDKLCDEIYCQLIKQATNNLKEKWLLRIWELIAFCTGCFVPSPAFYKPFCKFLDDTKTESNEIGAWASYCRDRLDKTHRYGKRLFVPTDRELHATRLRKPVMQTFYFMDGRQKQIPIYASTTSKEAFEFLLQMIALKDNKGYIVYEVYKTINKDTQQADFVERSLLYSEILCDSLRKFEEFRIQCSQNPSLDVETYFLVKRKLFLNPRVLSSDPVEINLLYHQTLQTIRSGSLLVKEEDAIIIAALELQIKYGDYVPGRSYTAKELIPINIRHHRSEKDWKKEIDEIHHKLLGLDKDHAKESYLYYCSQLPFFGYHLFPVRYNGNWKMPNNVYIGINVAGIFFLSADKDVYYGFSFMEVKAHSCNANSLKLIFDCDSVEVYSNKGDEIISLLIDYKYYHLKEDS